MLWMDTCVWSSPLAFRSAPTQSTHTHRHTHESKRNFIRPTHNTIPRPRFLLCARVHELFLPYPNNGSPFSVWQSFSTRLHTVCACVRNESAENYFLFSVWKTVKLGEWENRGRAKNINSAREYYVERDEDEFRAMDQFTIFFLS